MTWNRVWFALTIAFGCLIALEFIGFVLTLFGAPQLYCLMERCYP